MGDRRPAGSTGYRAAKTIGLRESLTDGRNAENDWGNLLRRSCRAGGISSLVFVRRTSSFSRHSKSAKEKHARHSARCRARKPDRRRATPRVRHCLPPATRESVERCDRARGRLHPSRRAALWHLILCWAVLVFGSVLWVVRCADAQNGRAVLVVKTVAGRPLNGVGAPLSLV
jgi:hypothetical protein